MESFQIENVNLYVEKYANGELLLDFINESEFLYFLNRGDYSPQMRMPYYLPSQILLHNVYDFRAKERSILKLPMKGLWELREKVRMYDNERYSNIFLELDCTDNIRNLLNSGRKVNGREIKKFQKVIKGTWQTGLPCALEHLGDEIEVIVLDVGQGSSNFIKDRSNLTIFDFGTSIYSKASDMYEIINAHKKYFDNARSMSLIISHWDCDHYNLLTSVDDVFLKKLCCVFVPETVISLTAKNVVKRLEEKCNFIRTFSSPNRSIKWVEGMQLIANRPHYDFFMGEKTNDINNSGLALTVYGDKAAIMLTADHTNKQVWEYMFPQIVNRNISGNLNLTMPHHGGKCGVIRSLNKLTNAGEAIVSVGLNYYKHPNQTALDTYESLGFNIRRTDWERNDIIIHL